MKLQPEVFRMLFAVARLDGKIHPAESALLDFLADAYGLGDLRAELESEPSTEASVEALAEALAGPEEREHAYELACLLTLMDGSQDMEESAFLVRLAQGLDLDVTAQARARTRAQEIYGRYQSRSE